MLVEGVSYLQGVSLLADNNRLFFFPLPFSFPAKPEYAAVEIGEADDFTLILF